MNADDFRLNPGDLVIVHNDRREAKGERKMGVFVSYIKMQQRKMEVEDGDWSDGPVYKRTGEPATPPMTIEYNGMKIPVDIKPIIMCRVLIDERVKEVSLEHLDTPETFRLYQERMHAFYAELRQIIAERAIEEVRNIE